MVDGAALESCDVVAEELERDGARDDGGVEWALRDGDMVVDGGNGFVIAFGDNAEDPGIAGLAFGDVAERFVFAGAFITERDHGDGFLEEGNGAVLEFGGVVAFGVNVRDLFKFERAFQGDGIQVAPADEEGRALVEIAALDGGDVVVIKVDGLACVRDDGGGIGSDDGFFFAKAKNDGRSTSGDDESAWFFVCHSGDAEGAFDLFEGNGDSLG